VVLIVLAQAAKLSPAIASAMNRAKPHQVKAGTAEACRFLEVEAIALEQAGFDVVVPAWWAASSQRRLHAVATASAPGIRLSSGAFSLDSLVKFDWQLALGDTPLTLQELKALARIKLPLVQVRGEWIRVNAEEIAQAVAFWKGKPRTEGTLRDALMMEIGAKTGPAELPVMAVRCEGAVKAFLEPLLNPGKRLAMEPPPGFQGTLRPYQSRGAAWLNLMRRVGLGACLADDMGLGKSVQTIVALLQATIETPAAPVLLVGPTSVVGHWHKEIARFAPDLAVRVHHGADRPQGKAFAKALEGTQVVLTSYALLHRDAATLQSIGWQGVILDEAQAIKNADSKTAAAARGLTAGFRVALTGTPVENHVGDLWSISQFLNPGLLGSRQAFNKGTLVPIQIHRDEAATLRLKRLMGPFLLRRLKTDPTIIQDLPEKIESKVYCGLTREQATLYQAVVEDLDATLDDGPGIRRQGQVLAALAKLKQVCNHPAQFLKERGPLPRRSGKLTRFAEMMQNVLAIGDRALVFTQFVEMGELLRAHLQDCFGQEVLFLHGGIPMDKRQLMVQRFQDTAAADAPRIFIISLKAGGTGLTLTAANHVFHYDRWWNPAVENQATDRAFRIGQTRNVQVHKFVCSGTLEERIDETIERKSEVAGRVVGSGEAWLTQMSKKDLKALLQLRADAIEDDA
jgi:SNF2 family DNA or RNA helicase